ncbi:hypothetical protein Caci_3380 [Catenulispora acidiphila DSM 44928]|uniref:Uncharacterized protein n=1 Tax=Catenulispora acidiphila (strain DSM 44928 / JCM 14897 / NBRC 102108 / NRRL B-24433 / ID139908) TaxID=479433 RepID=C7Q7U3_CATAD|nr:hypothetical protein [Catenulispora acidiphila]ACU72286.1 hypothetical protein Caci_3380 [Catenulispora acidiphila DSM 44928]
MIGLIAAALVPAAGSAAVVWDDSGSGLASVRAERRGIQYLGQTVKLLVSVAEAQSSAVRNLPTSPPDLSQAVAAVDATGLPSDPDPGAGTLWAQIRPQVLALSGTSTTGAAAYRAYGQVTDLLLQQIAAIDDASGLVPDSRADAYHLIDALTVWLPDMAVQAGRYDDQVTLAEPDGTSASASPDAARAAATAQVAMLRDRIAVDAHAFVTALNKVFRTTASATLGPHLLGDVDLVNTDINALAPTASAIDDALIVPSAPTVSEDRKAFDPAVQVLETAGLDELDKLLQAREAGYDRQRTAMAALLGGGAVVAVLSLWWLWRQRGADTRTAERATTRTPARTVARFKPSRPEPEVGTSSDTPARQAIPEEPGEQPVPAAAEPVEATDPVPLTLPERRP